MITQIRRSRASDNLTEQIIGCCFRVHRALGPGFPEKVYQTALVAAVRNSGLSADEERSFEVTFEGKRVGAFRVDLLIDGRVLLEVKAVTGMLPRIFAAQVLAYLKAAQLPVGLLVNFGNESCQIKRLSLSSIGAALSAKSAFRVSDDMQSAKSNI